MNAQDPQRITIGNVLYPVSDLPAAVSFYSALGLPLSFQDGDRFAAYDAGTTFALTARSENVTHGHVAVSFRVTDVDAAVDTAIAAGSVLLTAAEDGPHERRAVLEDPWHNTFVLYSTIDPAASR